MNELLAKAENELEEFLERNPNMKEEQIKIRELLDKTPQEQRMEVLGILLSIELLEMQKKLLELSKLYLKIS